MRTVRVDAMFSDQTWAAVFALLGHPSLNDPLMFGTLTLEIASPPTSHEAGVPAASCLRKPPRRSGRLQTRHAYTMCPNDQSGIVAMAATLCGSEAAKLKAATPPAAPALAEVAAAVASFSGCPRFFATSLSCYALAFCEAGGSRPRQSEPSSFVLPAGVQGLDAVNFLVERLDGPAQRWADTEQACNDPSG